MMQKLKQLGGIFLAFAAVASLYIGAEDWGHVEWFWIVLGASVIAWAARLLIQKLPELLIRYKNYPILLRVNVDLKREVEIRDNTIAGLETFVGQGPNFITEGRMQVVGALVAGAVDPPNITGVYSKGGVVYFEATYSTRGLYLYGRYNVSRISSPDFKGIVQVFEVNEASATLKLICIDPRDRAYWKKLGDRAVHDFGPPNGVELLPYSLPEGWDDIDYSRYAIPEQSEKVDGS